MIPTVVLIAMAEIRHDIEQAPDDLVARLNVAMRATRNSSWCRNDDEQFRAAVGAVMTHYGEGSEEWSRLEAEMKKLQAASLIIQAAMAGMTVVPPELDDSFEPIGLLALWHKTKES